MVVWITGLSGAGKSTVAQLMVEKIKPQLSELILVEGDVLRQLFGQTLDYSEASRKVQIKRIQRMARFLLEQNMVVIVTALYSHPDLLRWNRENLREYFEVYIDTPLDVVIERDVKGIYAKAEVGDLENVVGLDIPWYAPRTPDIHIMGADGSSPEDFVNLIVDKCPILRQKNIRI